LQRTAHTNGLLKALAKQTFFCKQVVNAISKTYAMFRTNTFVEKTCQLISSLSPRPTYLTVLFSILFLTQQIGYAQPPMVLTCNQVELQMVPVSSACGKVSTCSKQYYQVRLRANNLAQTSTYFQLMYCSMGFNVNVSVPTGAISDLGEVCAESSLASNLTVDKVLNNMTFAAMSDGLTTAPMLVFQDGFCNLFAFAVEIFPGETAIISANSSNWSHNGMAECEPNVTANSVQCTTLPSTPPPPLVGTLPTNTFNGKSFQFGAQIPIGSGPNITEISVPIEFKGTNINSQFFRYLDIAISYTSNNPMLNPEIVPSAGVNVTSSIVLPNGPSATYTFYLRFENILVSGNNPVLATLKIKEPVIASQSANVNLSFGAGRVIFNNVCFRAGTGPNVPVVFPGASPCASGIGFIINGSLGNGCKMFTNIELPWPSTSGILQTLRLRLKLNKPSGLTFDNLVITGLPCVPPNPANACPGFTNQCWMYDINTDILEICYSNGVGGIPIGIITMRAEFTSNNSNNNGGGCLPAMTVLDAFIEGSVTCIPSVTQIGYPLCFLELSGDVVKPDFKHVCDDYATITSSTANFSPKNTPIDAGKYSYCIIDPGTYTVNPFNNFFHLDGVDMLDVLKIQRHILGLEPLSLYGLLAADVNNNNAVTASDITEIRKLVLGANSVFPVKNSWTFVDKDYVFPNPSDPFIPVPPPSTKTVSVQPNVPGKANFIGIKTGDVTLNNTAGCPLKTFLTDFVPLTEQIVEEKTTSQLLLLNILNQSTETLQAWQGGFRFDPTKYRFVQVLKSDDAIMRPEDFDLSHIHDGLIKAAWCIMEPDAEGVLPQKTLFSVFLEKLSAQPVAISQVLQMDETQVQCLAFGADDRPFRMDIAQHVQNTDRTTQAKQDDLHVIATPNPATDVLHLQFAWNQQDRVQLLVYDAFGRRVAFREMVFGPGSHSIEVAEVASFPTGIYKWVLRSRKLVSSDVFLKQ
jgi:hypothetical protein